MKKILIILGIIIFLGAGLFIYTYTPARNYIQQKSGITLPSNPLSSYQATGFLHVEGTKIIDASGNPIILQGAMMESSLAYINRWNKGQNPTETLNSTTFNAMKSWNMNALRINTSQWIYQLDPSKYMQKLDQIITQANQAGLYVIVDFHDDTQSGSPHGDGMLHRESLDWWKTIAGHYKDNPMVMFDPINEPHYPDWQTWLNGNGNDIVGFQNVIDAIRSTGAKQIIVVEPGSAGKGNNSEDGGWSTYNVSLTDQNILYSKHDYHNIVNGNPDFWDRQWGPILNHYPIYYGEWAVLPSADHPVHCQNLTSDNADQVTTQFLQYLKSRSASWTYWDFEPYRLIQNYKDFTPTSFQTGAPWTCDSPSAKQAGAGEIIKSYLTGNLNTNITEQPVNSVLPSPAKKKRRKL